MNDESSLEMFEESRAVEWREEANFSTSLPPRIPAYLSETYWWAYLHPNSFWFFEREWVVNLILWGNMKRLTDEVLNEVPNQPFSRVLQVACVYGGFSKKLASKLGENGSSLDIADVATIQLDNVRGKLNGTRNVRFLHQDSASMSLPNNHYDETVVFFLLHEQPEEVRSNTVSEALRVTRPGGKVIFVDYHGPKWTNPLRYLMKPLLKWLEPFALDMWKIEIQDLVPAHLVTGEVQSQQYFGGLYQKQVFIRR
jgi:ubiquinone/menaquinone biosynthesis C-methylase UbiE